VTISGVAAGAAGHEVTLLERTVGHPFAPVSTTATDAGGAYSFATAPLESTSYRVVEAGALSSVLFEGVRDVLTAAISTAGATGLSSPPAGAAITEATIEPGDQVTFAGGVSGAVAGRAVYLQRESSSGLSFHTVSSTSVDASSAYAFTYTFDAPGTWVMRVKVPAGPRSLGSASPPFTIHVARPATGP
jgi:hypothetical protein